VTTPAYRLRQGVEALRQGSPPRAEYYARLLEAGNRKNEACLLWGEIFVAQKQWGKALQELNRIEDDGALRVRAACLVGRCLLELQNHPEALRCFQFVLGQEPDNVDAHRGMAAFHYDLGNLSLAESHLETVARLDPTDARAHRLIGLIEKDVGRREHAIAAYREALRRGLSREVADTVRLELAECHLMEGQEEAALAVLDERSAQAAAQAEAAGLRIEALLVLKRTSEAHALLDSALQTHPNTGGLLRIRGIQQAEEGKNRDAAVSLERAVALDPNDHLSRYQLALVYERLDRSTEALEQHRLAKQTRERFEEMTRLSQEAMTKPQDADVRRRLAAVCRKLQKNDLAAMWDRAAASCQGP
jgi:tetratricopeptide (TPR) repeat protein